MHLLARDCSPQLTKWVRMPPAYPDALVTEFGQMRCTLVCMFAAMAAIVGPAARAADRQVGVAGALDQKTADKAFPAQRPYSRT